MKKLCSFAALLVSGSAFADQPVSFHDVTPGTPMAEFRKTPPVIAEEAEMLHQQSLIAPITFDEVILGPMMPRGLPGVAIFDYDRDGDLDMYVTNGPGSANALFHNELEETGVATFINVSESAGVQAIEQDSYGTCFGDIDNDGDHDLMVLGREEANILFDNLGDGTFAQLHSAVIDGNNLSSNSCSMGDFDNDGLIDIIVANGFDQADSLAIGAIPYDLNQPNQLLRNIGNKTFEDISHSSGILNNVGYPSGAHGISWAVASVDVDSDGDADIVILDDQGGILAARHGGEDRAYIHIFINDGSGHFIDQPLIQNAYSASEWMGVSTGDLDCNGTVDLFASSFGDYASAQLGAPYYKGGSASRAFFGNGDGSFNDSGAPIDDNNGGYTTNNESTAFGWGNAIFDADNDGDNDVLYHGGLDAAGLAVVADNPGILLVNEGACSGKLTWDPDAINTDHLTRNVRAVAVGDVDGNGFPDIATVSSLTTPPELPLEPMFTQYGDALDDSTYIVNIMSPVIGPAGDPGFVWNGYENGFGDFKLELNTGNENHHITVDVQGNAGLVDNGRVNRDGIGALISFTPGHNHHNRNAKHQGITSLQAVVAGSSHSSSHALRKTFGLGSARFGTLDILWPGGTKNRLYKVRAGEHIVMPEIPCNYEAKLNKKRDYTKCVSSTLNTLYREGHIDRKFKTRLYTSAMRAYNQHRQVW